MEKHMHMANNISHASSPFFKATKIKKKHYYSFSGVLSNELQLQLPQLEKIPGYIKPDGNNLNENEQHQPAKFAQNCVQELSEILRT
jgi:flagellar basal body rod protein FlgB